MVPALQRRHAAPPRPQEVSALPCRHVAPEQQPLQFAGEQGRHAPLMHRSVSAQRLQTTARVPHATSLVPSRHAPFEQQPAQSPQVEAGLHRPSRQRPEQR